MAPPAAGPLIHGSTTPIANETATAASTASPPASSTAAPTSAARRCAAATTPPRVGMTALRTIGAMLSAQVMPTHSRSNNGVASLAYIAGIHFFLSTVQLNKTWMAGTSLDKPGHDGGVEEPCLRRHAVAAGCAMRLDRGKACVDDHVVAGEAGDRMDR